MTQQSKMGVSIRSSSRSSPSRQMAGKPWRPSLLVRDGEPLSTRHKLADGDLSVLAAVAHACALPGDMITYDAQRDEVLALASLQANLQNVQRDIARLNKLRSSEEVFVQLKGENKRLKKALDEKEEDLKVCQAELKAAEEHANKQTAQVGRLVLDLSQHTTEGHGLKEEVKALKGEVGALKEKMKEAEEEVTEWKNRAEEAQEALEEAVGKRAEAEAKAKLAYTAGGEHITEEYKKQVVKVKDDAFQFGYLFALQKMKVAEDDPIYENIPSFEEAKMAVAPPAPEDPSASAAPVAPAPVASPVTDAGDLQIIAIESPPQELATVVPDSNASTDIKDASASGKGD